MPQKNERIESLDSIRGLAALQVVIHHSILMAPLFWAAELSQSWQQDAPVIANVFTFSPLHVMWAGHEAVVLFFVLSGFVLSMPYYRNTSVDYPGFFVKRIFRIYFPYVIALIIGAFCNSMFNGHVRMPALSAWFNDIWRSPITLGNWADYLLMRPSGFHNIVTSLWTIPVEIKISLAFPLFVLILRRLNKIGSLLFLFGNIAFYMIGTRLGFKEIVPDFALFYYFTFFLAGAIACKYRALLVSTVNKFSTATIILLVIAALLLYTYKWNIQLLPPSLIQLAKKFPADYTAGIAAIIVIVIGISDKAPQWLNSRYFILLGKVSFSLYLIHPIIIGIVGFSLGNTLPLFWLILLSVVISVICSIPFSKYIEIPLQNAGRNISKLLNKRKIIAPGYEK